MVITEARAAARNNIVDINPMVRKSLPFPFKNGAGFCTIKTLFKTTRIEENTALLNRKNNTKPVTPRRFRFAMIDDKA